MCVCKCVNNAGKDDSLAKADGGMTHAVVMKMVEGIEGRGHHVYVDNFYTSPQLFSDLRLSGCGACGTVRLNRRGLPKSLKQQPVKKGEMKAVQLDSSLLAVKWCDKRVVTVLTTIHDGSTVDTQRRSRDAPGGHATIRKPTAVAEYNKYMGGVDLADQLVTYYGFEHRSLKWWKKLFFFLMETAVVNSYILYCDRNPNKKNRYSHLKFSIELANDLLSSAGDVHAEQRLGPHQHPSQPAARLVERHFMVQGGQRNCDVCSGRKGRKRKTTTYWCRECNLPLCPTLCFELHHTKKDPRQHLPYAQEQ